MVGFFGSEEVKKYEDVDAVQEVSIDLVVAVGQPAPLLSQVPCAVNAGSKILDLAMLLKTETMLTILLCLLSVSVDTVDREAKK